MRASTRPQGALRARRPGWQQTVCSWGGAGRVLSSALRAATHLGLREAVAKAAGRQDLDLARGGGCDDLRLAIAIQVGLRGGGEGTMFNLVQQT